MIKKNIFRSIQFDSIQLKLYPLAIRFIVFNFILIDPIFFLFSSCWSQSGNLSSYSNWHSIEPNNHGGHEDCVELRKVYDFQWNDEHCRGEKQFVCEVNTGNKEWLEKRCRRPELIFVFFVRCFQNWRKIWSLKIFLKRYLLHNS